MYTRIGAHLIQPDDGSVRNRSAAWALLQDGSQRLSQFMSQELRAPHGPSPAPHVPSSAWAFCQCRFRPLARSNRWYMPRLDPYTRQQSAAQHTGIRRPLRNRYSFSYGVLLSSLRPVLHRALSEMAFSGSVSASQRS